MSALAYALAANAPLTFWDKAETFYRTAQVPLIAAMIALTALCWASLNFIWKMREEVYAKEAYLRSVKELREIDPDLKPLKGFDELRWLTLMIAASAVTTAGLQLVIGFFYQPWSIVICLVPLPFILLAVGKVTHLFFVTTAFAARLSSMEAEEKMAKFDAPASTPH